MNEATPRPWAWFDDGPGSPYLATVDRGRVYVMGFARRGMHFAQPMFQVHDDPEHPGNGAMKTANELGPYWSEHPDAALIVTAVNSYDRLVAIEKAARDLCDPTWPLGEQQAWANLRAALEGASE